MLINYIKIAFRNVLRNRSNTFINIIGLSIGISACLLIFLVIRFEESFDTFHKNRDRIYRVVSVFRTPDGAGYSRGVPFPVTKALRLDYPQLEKVGGIFETSGLVTLLEGKNKNQKFDEDAGIFYAEPEIFDIFDFKWLSGNPKTVLSEPNSAALTVDMANKYFGNWKDAIGKTIKFKNKYVYKISGIIKNIPANSDFPFKIVISFNSLKETGIKENLNDWVSTFSNFNCFVLFPPELIKAKFEKFLKSFVNMAPTVHSD